MTDGYDAADNARKCYDVAIAAMREKLHDRKQQDTHADYQGTCTINGVEYYMNAWLKDGAKGKFMSFAFKPKEARTDGRAQAKPRAPQGPFGSDDTIPF